MNKYFNITIGKRHNPSQVRIREFFMHNKKKYKVILSILRFSISQNHPKQLLKEDHYDLKSLIHYLSKLYGSDDRK